MHLNKDQWERWRDQGWTTRRIAEALGKSPQRVRQQVRHWPDPWYRVQSVPVRTLDAAQELDAYLLGVVWGCLAASSEGYLC